MNQTLATMDQLTDQILTATRAPRTPAAPPNTQAWAKWASFDLSRGRPDEIAQLTRMLHAVARFASEMKRGCRPRWLSLLGPSGAGKTYLAKRVWYWAKESGILKGRVVTMDEGDQIIYPGRWCHWPRIASNMSENYGAINDMHSEQFVCLDEIGADRDPSGLVRDKLATMLCARVDRWTLVTSNKTLEQVATDIDTRVASRMIRDGSEVVEIDVRDYALRT